MTFSASKGKKSHYCVKNEKIRIWGKKDYRLAAAEIQYQWHFPKESIYSKNLSGFIGVDINLQRKLLFSKASFFFMNEISSIQFSVMVFHYSVWKCCQETFADFFTAVDLFTKDVLDCYFSLLEICLLGLYKISYKE